MPGELTRYDLSRYLGVVITPDGKFVKHTDVAALEAENEKLRAENCGLRVMLAWAYAGSALYTDDGELQDNRSYPFIDFNNDSVEDIDSKLGERAREAARKDRK